MLNAFTEDILCPSCHKTNTFSQETWQGILDDVVKDAPKFKADEGQTSTIFRGEYNYNLIYGKQEPRCRKCKQDIDVSRIEEYSAKGGVSCTKCSTMIFVRKPSKMVLKSFPAVKYLAGEDDDMLSVNKTGAKFEASSKPVLFICPSCAGNLEIDGTDRMITCKYCDSQIYLPDDLWFRLHPAKSVDRWYLLVDQAEASLGTSGMPEWQYFCDLTIDKQGNLYMCATQDSSDNFIAWSLGPDLKTRWVRNDLKFRYEDTGITISNKGGSLYLWNNQRLSILEISAKDGSTIKKIDGFNMKGCGSLVSDRDGTILALIHNTVVRLNTSGQRVQLWKGKKFGLFSSGVGEDVPKENPEWAPYLKEVGSFPKRINSEYTPLNMGWDGFLYFMDRSSSDGEVAKYDADGTQLWSKLIPLRYKDCKPCVDSAGNVYILGTTDESHTHLVKYIPGADRFETLLTDVLEGGALDDETRLAVSPEGKVYILNTYGGMKVFSPDMKLEYRSKQSEENDNDALEEKRKKIEKDEEYN
jgi:DNA-directed RNA polymerase subunit RPC12/RpoP